METNTKAKSAAIFKEVRDKVARSYISDDEKEWNHMNKIMIGLAILVNMTFLPVKADPEVKGWKTLDSMGCMMVKCTDEVREIKLEDLGPEYGDLVRN